MFDMQEKTATKLRAFLLSLPLALYVFFYWISHSGIDILIPLAVSVIVLAALCVLLYFVVEKHLCGRVTKVFKPLGETSKTTDTKMPVRSLIFIAVSSFGSLALLSQSSPLYPINTWGDSNIYFTVSKAMLHGQVLYRDIFDQKGFYHYVLHMPGILISDTTFTGIYIVEAVCTIVFLLFIHKIILLYSRPSVTTDLLVAALPFILFSGSAFFQGDSAEELMLPFYAATAYIGLKALREGRMPNVKEAGIIGLLTGFVFWTKYTMCGIFLGFVIWITVKMIRRRNYQMLGKLALAFIAGFIAIAIPVFVYFLVNRAVPDLINGYFLDNFVVYAESKSEEALPLAVRLAFTFIFFFANCDLLIFALIFLGFLGFALTGRKGGAYSFLMSLACGSLVGVYIGGYTIRYYAIIFYAFAAMIAVPLALLLNDLAKESRTRTPVYIIAVILCLASIPAAFFRSENTYFILTPRSNIPQYKFAQYISQSEDKTLINYRFLDGGFYMVTDTLPFICHYCMYYDDVFRLEDQLNAISNRDTHFIITRNECPEFDGYTLIDEATIESTFTGTLPIDNAVYYLYEVNR